MGIYGGLGQAQLIARPQTSQLLERLLPTAMFFLGS